MAHLRLQRSWRTAANTDRCRLSGFLRTHLLRRAQKFYQHHITTYMAMMGVPAILEVAWQPRIALGWPAVLKTSALVARTGGLKAMMEREQRPGTTAA